MNILVIGNGGREHAIIDAVKKSKLIDSVFALPGNAGIATVAKCIGNADTTNEEIIELVKKYNIDLTIVGPEAYIMRGIADDFAKAGLRIFCPSKEAGLIEGSKEYAKLIMDKYDVLTAEYKCFDSFEKADEYIRKLSQYPIVVKYDGLAAGKGVYILDNYEDTKEVLLDLLQNQTLGTDKVVIEQFLDGEEFTLMALVNGETVVPLPVARDFKKALDGDLGNNTGGMGCICPFDKITDIQKQEAITVLNKVANGLVKEGKPFTGVLYGGFIATKNGVQVIEFNARFGDPETEVVLQKVKSDLVQLILDVMNNKAVEVEVNDNIYTGVVLTAKGYPSSYLKNIDMTEFLNDDFVTYHMSTATQSDKYISKGGRIMCITNNASTKKDSFDKIYEFLNNISNSNVHYRKDLRNY